MSGSKHVLIAMWLRRVLMLYSVSLVAACGGGSELPSEQLNTFSPPVTVTPETPPAVVPSGDSTDIFPSVSAANRFLSQATFGPSLEQSQALNGHSMPEWLVSEFNKPASFHLEYFDDLAHTY